MVLQFLEIVRDHGHIATQSVRCYVSELKIQHSKVDVQYGLDQLKLTRFRFYRSKWAVTCQKANCQKRRYEETGVKAVI